MARKSRKNLDVLTAPTIELTPTATVYNAAGYIRLSVEDNKKKGESVETQKTILENFITLAPDMKLHDFYIDNGISGTTFERPAFKKMLADAESGVINCIIVKDLSRMGRNAIDTGYYIEKYLPSIGCRFVAVNDDFDTNGDMNNSAGVILPLKNIINEAYALDIGRKIKAQQRQAMKDGEYVGARPPYGFLKSPDNCHKLIIDPIAAPTVRQIFEWFLDEVSVNHIVRRLNEAKIPTPSHYRKSMGIITHENLIGNGAWQTFTVTRILENDVYVGDMVQGKSQTISRKQTQVNESEWIRVQDTHEAIITRETLAKAKARLKFLADKSAAKPKTPYSPNIFKGKVFCGHCGCSMHRTGGWKRKKTGERRYVFRCPSNDRKARGSCETFTIQEADVKDALFAIIQSHAGIIIGNSLKLRKCSADVDSKREEVKAELSALKLETDKTGRMFKSLYESLVDKLITGDEYREMREKYEIKMQENLARAVELKNNQAELDKQITEYCKLSDLIADTENNSITASVIDCLVDRIHFFADRTIKIDFLFNKEFGLVSDICGFDELGTLDGISKLNNTVRYDSGGFGATGLTHKMGVMVDG